MEDKLNLIIAQNKKIIEQNFEIIKQNNELKQKTLNLDVIIKEFNQLKINQLKINQLNVLPQLKKEYFDIDNEFVVKVMLYKDHRTILKIIEKYYENGYPFKYKRGEGFDYYVNGKWIHDTYGDIILDILLYNVKILLFKSNIFDNFNLNQISENQNFIHSISINKFKRNFIKHLKNMLSI